MTEGHQLQLAFVRVRGRLWNSAGRVTAQLGHPRFDGRDQRDEILDRDAVRPELPCIRLPVEASDVANSPAKLAKRDVELVGQLERRLPCGALTVDVLVRVEV